MYAHPEYRTDTCSRCTRRNTKDVSSFFCKKEVGFKSLNGEDANKIDLNYIRTSFHSPLRLT